MVTPRSKQVNVAVFDHFVRYLAPRSRLYHADFFIRQVHLTDLRLCESLFDISTSISPCYSVRSHHVILPLFGHVNRFLAHRRRHGRTIAFIRSIGTRTVETLGTPRSNELFCQCSNVWIAFCSIDADSTRQYCSFDRRTRNVHYKVTPRF